jgi:hypothetical protein
MSDATRILHAIEQGDSHAAEQLLPLVYDELRRLAAQKLAQEKPGQTLQATALVHEAYIRLVDTGKAQHWDSQASLGGGLSWLLSSTTKRRSSPSLESFPAKTKPCT